MDAVLRAAVIYLILFALFRVFGKRTMSDLTAFDFLLLLVISEATQQALLGEDFSIMQAVLVIATLMTLDRLWDALSARFPLFRALAQSRPRFIVSDGKRDSAAMRSENITDDDILRAARSAQGLESLDQIKHVVLEPNGGLSIIPKR